MRNAKTLKALLGLFVMAAMVFGGAACKRKQRADETAEQFKKYKQANYWAQTVYGVDALSDLFEIFKNGGVVDANSAKEAVKVIEQASFGLDEVGLNLKNGLPAGNKFEKARAVVASLDAAINAGAIKFKSERAQNYYLDAKATVEVAINLLEAASQGNEVAAAKFEALAEDRIARLQQGQGEPRWWNNAIVRITRLLSDARVVASKETPDIWAAGEAKSAEAHSKNTNRLATW